MGLESGLSLRATMMILRRQKKVGPGSEGLCEEREDMRDEGQSIVLAPMSLACCVSRAGSVLQKGGVAVVYDVTGCNTYTLLQNLEQDMHMDSVSLKGRAEHRTNGELISQAREGRGVQRVSVQMVSRRVECCCTGGPDMSHQTHA